MKVTEYSRRIGSVNERYLKARFVHITPGTISFEVVGQGDKPVVLTPTKAKLLESSLRKNGWKQNG